MGGGMKGDRLTLEGGIKGIQAYPNKIPFNGELIKYPVLGVLY
jgi:hypothetical protein